MDEASINRTVIQPHIISRPQKFNVNSSDIPFHGYVASQSYRGLSIGLITFSRSHAKARGRKKQTRRTLGSSLGNSILKKAVSCRRIACHHAANPLLNMLVSPFICLDLAHMEVE